MLSIAKCRDGSYYLDLAAEDYYLEGGEPPGIWSGKGAELLGVAGQVDKADFRKLWHGFSLDGEPLVQNAGRTEPNARGYRPQRAWDCTFSAPKSVSVLWAMADPETRAAIQRAHDQAVTKSLDYLEDQAGHTRRGKGGAEVERAGMLFARFEHGTSRNQDPQLHTHALALNIAFREDGSTGTLETRPLFRHKMAAGALYQAELSHLMERLGYRVVQEKTWGFELVGVPQQIRDAFSTRRAEIEEALSGKGFSSAKAAELAALDTRSAKLEHAPRAELFESWQRFGEGRAFGPREAEDLARVAPKHHAKDFTAYDFARQAVSTLTENRAYFAPRELTRKVAQQAPGHGLSAVDVLRAVERVLDEQGVPLGRQLGEIRYTTPEILRMESKVFDLVTRSEERSGAPVRAKDFATAMDKRPELGPDQRSALEHLFGDKGSVRVVSGVAGSGKTTLLDAAREGWESAGYDVVGLAPTGKAARGLEDGAGIPSFTADKALIEWQKGGFEKPKTHALQDTLARAAGLMSEKEQKFWSWQRERAPLELGERTVIVVDEAGMLDTLKMARVLDAAARAGAKVMLLGAKDQLPAIGPGAPFGAIAEQVGQSVLTNIVRQQQEWQRVAVHDIREGRAKEALSAYAERGFFHLAETRDDARRELVEKWALDVAREDPKGTLILAGTNADVSALNRLAQEARAGELEGRSVKLGSGERAQCGDRVLLTKNDSKLDVRNGDFGTVVGVDTLRRHLAVELDTERTVLLPLRDYSAVKLGYAATVHKAQGATVDRAYAMLGGVMQDRELSYVEMSRHRDHLELFADRETAGPLARDLERQMEKSRQQELASQQLKIETPELALALEMKT